MFSVSFAFSRGAVSFFSGKNKIKKICRKCSRQIRFQLSPEAFRFFGFGGLFRRRPLEHRQGEPKRTGPDGQDAALPADVRAQRAEQDKGQQHQQDQEQDACDLQQGQQQPAQSHQDSHHVAASPS